MTRLSIEDVQRIVRGDRKPQSPALSERHELSEREQQEMYDAAFGVDDAIFWRKDRELADVYENPSPQFRKTLDQWYGGIAATVATGTSTCPICLREIESGENCCPHDGPFIYADQPGYEDWRGR